MKEHTFKRGTRSDKPLYTITLNGNIKFTQSLNRSSVHTAPSRTGKYGIPFWLTSSGYLGIKTYHILKALYVSNLVVVQCVLFHSIQNICP